MSPATDVTIQWTIEVGDKTRGYAVKIDQGWFDEIPGERKIAFMDALLEQIQREVSDAS